MFIYLKYILFIYLFKVYIIYLFIYLKYILYKTKFFFKIYIVIF